MKKGILPLLVLAVLLAGMAAGGAVLAQTSAHYNLEWHVIGGGGAPAASTHYAVNSTAGQGLAGPPYASSARFVVSAGYWYVAKHFGYLPVVLRLR